MKNINFSPLAERKILRYYYEMRGHILLILLIILAILVILLWQKSIESPRVQIAQKPVQDSHLAVTSPPKEGEAENILQMETSAEKEALPIPKPEVIGPAPNLPPSEEVSSEENTSAENPPEVIVPQEIKTSGEEESGLKTAELNNNNLPKIGQGYYLKILSAVVKNDAEYVADFLRSHDFSPQIIREPGRAQMYNIYVQPVKSLSYRQMKEKLEKDGVWVYTPPDLQEDAPEATYYLRVGSCYYKESADHLLKNLKSKGYFGTIKQENTPVNFYSIFLGEYPDHISLLQEQKRLMLEGFYSSIAMKNPEERE